MPLRPQRTVHVSTREALDAALRDADRVVVDGDDALLSYAIAKTAGDPERHVDVETPAPAPASPNFNAPLHMFAASAAPVPAGFENDFAPVTGAPAPASGPPRRSRSAIWILAIAVIVIAAGALAAFLLWPHGGAGPVPPENPALQVAPAPPPEPDLGLPAATQPPAPSLTNTAGVINAIAWPAVAVIATLALALIARQAISAGRNVEFSWKVTEKVSGRVVITKVRTPSPHSGAPA